MLTKWGKKKKKTYLVTCIRKKKKKKLNPLVFKLYGFWSLALVISVKKIVD
jgi:hypothetical protein